MNRLKIFLLLLSGTLTLAGPKQKVEWPLGKCSRNDPNLNQCIINMARKAIPLIVPGNKKLELPRLDPLRIGNYTLRVNQKPVSLELGMFKSLLMGTGNISIISVDFHKDMQKLEMYGLHKSLALKGNYSLKGKLLLAPVNSKGRMHITLKNMFAHHIIQFIPKIITGETFMDVRVNFKIVKIDLMQINLTNTTTQNVSGERLSKLMNDNWRLLFTAFTPSIEKMVEAIFTKAFGPMFSKFSYDELLPPS